MADSERVELLHGTLDLIVLRALATMGPLHAYALASRLEQVADYPLIRKEPANSVPSALIFRLWPGEDSNAFGSVLESASQTRPINSHDERRMGENCREAVAAPRERETATSPRSNECRAGRRQFP